jgi:hypothetical protein
LYETDPELAAVAGRFGSENKEFWAQEAMAKAASTDDTAIVARRIWRLVGIP